LGHFPAAEENGVKTLARQHFGALSCHDTKTLKLYRGRNC
jgi:hypothetical protein